MKTYKVLEVIWLKGFDFQQEYCKTFRTLKGAIKYVNKHISEWKHDCLNYSDDTQAIGVEIERFKNDEFVDSYTEYHIERKELENE